MDSRVEVVCLGRTAMDILCVTEGYPAPDTKHELSDFSLQGGGPAATAAVTLRRLGLACAYVGKVCDDFFGRFMVESLEKEGVETRGVRVRPGGRASQFACIAVDRATGARTILWTHGDAGDLDPEEVDGALLSHARALHLDGHFAAAALHAARAVRAGGGIVSLDAGTLRPGMEKLVAASDIVIATERFALDLTGAGGPEAALEAMARSGIPVAGITLGARGSLLASGGERIAQPAYEVEAVDTTGAGDVYHGAFLAGRLLGYDLRGCAELASAAAALKCTRLGGRPGIQDLKTTLAFIEERRR